MPDLSEFVSFVAEKSEIVNVDLVERDVILHKILKEFCSSNLSSNYLFKGGSCLVKCYFGYYRFSVDLDFTWKNQKVWLVLRKNELRKGLIDEIRKFALLLKTVSEQLNLEFEAELANKKFLEFGGGRMATFKLWKGSELIKIQVNFLEKLLFHHKNVIARTLLGRNRLSGDMKAYFKEFLDFYRPIRIMAYDEREILCEKVRAILTRRAQKLRDFYDLFMLSEHGFKVEDQRKEIIDKVKWSLYYKKYRDNLESNRKGLEVDTRISEDPFERSLLMTKSQKGFEDFLETAGIELREIASKV